MKKCKACQKEIDDKAKKCPHCQTDQRNWFARHPIMTGLLGLIVLIIVISAAGSGGKKSDGTASTETKSSETKSSTAQATAKVGEAVVNEDLSFTVTDVKQEASLGNQYTNKQAQGVFYVISLKIENKSNQTKTIDSSMITLTDSQGRKYDRSIEGQTAKGLTEGKVDLFLQQVQPSLSVNGDIVFDLPKDATGLKLNVKGSLFGKGTDIDLGK